MLIHKVFLPARLLSISSPHAAAWLSVIPSLRLNLHLEPAEFQTAVKWWFGIAVTDNPVCSFCPYRALDPLGHRALDPLGHRALDPIGHHALDPLGHHALDPLGHHALDPLGHHALDPLGHHALDPLGHRALDPLGHRALDPLGHCALTCKHG